MSLCGERSKTTPWPKIKDYVDLAIKSPTRIENVCDRIYVLLPSTCKDAILHFSCVNVKRISVEHIYVRNTQRLRELEKRFYC